MAQSFVVPVLLQEYADAEGLQLFETSAKDGTNVELALVTMSAMIKQSN